MANFRACFGKLFVKVENRKWPNIEKIVSPSGHTGPNFITLSLYPLLSLLLLVSLMISLSHFVFLCVKCNTSLCAYFYISFYQIVYSSFCLCLCDPGTYSLSHSLSISLHEPMLLKILQVLQVSFNVQMKSIAIPDVLSKLARCQNCATFCCKFTLHCVTGKTARFTSLVRQSCLCHSNM